ncbi:hypothetical protein [Protofrankia coriariae]|uniref:hypothetical protein n=1 Tax=Protofrankia coriariae TaxID=1562887 RepID=UPI0019102C88|nr:hypothetical protein [Protofrankia coriariae]
MFGSLPSREPRRARRRAFISSNIHRGISGGSCTGSDDHVDVTCGGATVTNLLTTPQGNHPVQVDALAAADARVPLVDAYTASGGHDICAQTR